VKRNPNPSSVAEILRRLRALADPKARAIYSYFKCTPTKAYGVRAPLLHRLAREIGRNHNLALKLWATGVHEARSVAALIDQPERVTRQQMERWAGDFDSWDVVDSCCCYLFPYTRDAWKVIPAWSRRREEFVKRAAFAQLAYLTYKDKSASDEQFAKHLPLIRRHATDPRNFVKKAVNWALRNIGKRNRRLNAAAIRTAQQIRTQVAPACKDAQGRTAALWCAADALRELQSPGVQRRLHA
jgi:3-methyladenine DNA glycosylase AlkD